MQRDLMDPWRQQILSDIGISTWIRRDQMPSSVEGDISSEVLPEQARPQVSAAAEAQSPEVRSKPPIESPERAQSAAAGSALAALSESLDAGSAAKSARRPARQSTVVTPTPLEASAEAVRYPEVACLWAGDAVLFCSPAELLGQVRLVKDILASAANNWTQATEQVIFRWAELQASGFAAAEADRALLAFAEKRIEVSTARWVLCTPSLEPLLAQLVLPVSARLLGLAELAELARGAALKQSLWQALHEGADNPPNKPPNKTSGQGSTR